MDLRTSFFPLPVHAFSFHFRLSHRFHDWIHVQVIEQTIILLFDSNRWHESLLYRPDGGTGKSVKILIPLNNILYFSSIKNRIKALPSHKTRSRVTQLYLIFTQFLWHAKIFELLFHFVKNKLNWPRVLRNVQGLDWIGVNFVSFQNLLKYVLLFF